jgi:pyridoxal phosphate enzyme (YggS family)
LSDIADQIARNVARVRGQIDEAARRSGRTADEVTLVAVTKYVGLPEIEALRAAGVTDLGESRPQALWEKGAACGDDVRWHLVGHLQRNKIRRTLPQVALIHSVDSLRLLEALQREAEGLEMRTSVLLEVNVSGEAAKHGFAPDELPPLLAELPRLPRVNVQGLMTMAARDGGAETARHNFAELRQLRDALQAELPAGESLDELSMGMSGDFAEAIAEGATLVRIGSTLFEGLPS